jgi:thiamine-phosphate diphosphorylase
MLPERGPIAAPIICLITDRRRLAAALGIPPEGPAALDAVSSLALQAAAAGATLIQLREPDLAPAALYRLTEDLSAPVAERGAALLVNDRLDVALAAGAHGVHLKERSPAPLRIRSVAPPPFVIGCSRHTRDGAVDAAESGAADYLIVGPVYQTPSKPDCQTGIGVSGLREIGEGLAAPVLAVGGVTIARAGELAAAGAAGVAAIGLFIDAFASQTVQRAVETLRLAFDSAETVS